MSTTRPGYDRRPTISLPPLPGNQQHSALDIIGKLTFFLRERLSQVDLGTGPYTEDPNTSGFQVSNYLAEQEQEIGTPLGVSIGRGTQSFEQVSMGHLDQNQEHLRTRSLKEQYSQGSCPIRIECRASTPGAAELLGYVVGTAIHMTRDGLQQQFMWRSISQVAIQPCRPKEVGEEQNRIFSVSVEFIIFFEVRWASAYGENPPARAVSLGQKSPEDIDYVRVIASPTTED